MKKPNKHSIKIGLVLSVAPGYSETFFRSKIKGLIDAGHQVVLFSSKNPNSFDLCPVILLPQQHRNPFKQTLLFARVYFCLIPYLTKVIRFVHLERKANLNWLNIFKRIYSFAPVFKHDLDWLHFGFGTLVFGYENFAEAIKTKMAVSFRGFDIGVYPIKHPNCYEKLWDKVTKIHVISDDIADLVYKNGFKNQAPIVKITPAIDTQYFYSLQQTLLESPIQMLTVARLHWKKGLDYTLEALALLKAAGVSFEYRIIGIGPEEEALKFACYQLGLQEQVRFLGKLERADVKQQLENTHIYIQYSVQEGFCNAVLEAQAMGLLCIVSDAEGLSENVIHNVTGYVVPKRKPKELANIIQKSLDLSSDQKNAMKLTAIKRISQDFNLVKQRKEFLEFYSE